MVFRTSFDCTAWKCRRPPFVDLYYEDQALEGSSGVKFEEERFRFEKVWLSFESWRFSSSLVLRIFVYKRVYERYQL